MRHHLTVLEKVGYGLGDTATNLVWRTLMVFLPIFYTDVFGLSAAAVGTLLLVCRYWDGVTDLAMGVIADRTNTRWGKFRPWVLWSAVPFGVMTVLTFTTFDLTPTGKLMYAYLTYSGLIVAFTANNVPYSAMTGVMTSDPAGRTSVSSYRFVFAFLGGLITQGLNVPLVAFFGKGNEMIGYSRTMLLFSVLSVILFVITFLTTRERVSPIAHGSARLKEDVHDLVRNTPWLVLFGVGMLFVLSTTLKQGITMFYFKYFVGDLELASLFMISGLVAAMIGAALTPALTRIMNKTSLVTACFALAATTSGLLYLVKADDFAAMIILSSATEFATGPIVALIFAMLADTADYSEWKNGRRATGLLFSAGTVSFKFGTGIAGAITGWVLTLFGYVANVPQSAGALHGIRLLISVLPAAACVLAIIVFWFYRIDQPMLDTIQRELELRKGEAAA